jgi:hypothetical protein
VNTSEADHPVNAVDADDFSVQHQLAQDSESNPILLVVKSGYEHYRVSDVEVQVACGEAVPIAVDRRWIWKLNDLKRSSL